MEVICEHGVPKYRYGVESKLELKLWDVLVGTR